MVVTKKTVLITGCSDGGMGAALALAFHNANYHVYATARNPKKMEGLASAGIETLTLDVLSDSSIAECVAKVPKLDILVNNAGHQFLMPVVDVNIAEAKKLYDLNVWAHIAVIQAFLPRLMESKGIIVNQTSVGASVTLPFQAVYNSSKAALAMLSNSLRLEIECFGVRVVDLRTGVVKTNLIKNLQDSNTTTLPKGSIYEPARDAVEKSLRQEGFEGGGLPAQQWAAAVVQDLSKKTPPAVIWRGEQSLLSRIVAMLPVLSWVDGLLKQATGMDKVEQILKK
ncbi:NAD(P)-binding protein [Hypoxylon rubiginosum]|uniref:NAD(P)-binding protein n=1 Tax=Hypoxylon rubiginosum TaxID=110542 RepID=A0ACC0DEU3_9PEZI|nr:NAD(P)-binding protein [Hypoxylon rubiginosum]